MATKLQITQKLNEATKEIALASKTLGTLPPVINTLEEYRFATDAAALTATRIKNATTACKFFVDPLTTEAKQIKAQFATIIDPAEELLKQIKERLKAFAIAEQARRDEEQKLIEANAIKQMESGVESVQVPVVNETKTQSGSLGSSTARKIKKWRVMDMTMVPIQYLIVDDAEVTKAMRAGTPIPGIEFYEDTSIAIKLR